MTPDMDRMTCRRSVRSVRALIDRVQRRLAGEEAFSLIELTMVLLIMGILLTVAIPSYLSFKDRASKAAATTAISTAMRSVLSYGADNFPSAPNDPDSGISTGDTGYQNIRLDFLNTKYDSTLSIVPGDPFVIDPTGWNNDLTSATDFCMTAAVGRWIAVQHGPGAPIVVGTTFVAGSCTVS